MAKRQVFYSFHFDNDVMRVQQIRNVGVIEENMPVSANDWEQIKRSGDNSIRHWIDENMKYRSCVVVLVGSETANRTWVKYEIEKAWKENKGLVGIHIHNIKCPRNGISRLGPNPFEQYNIGEQPLSGIVKCYNPNPNNAYNDIASNIGSWIEEAIKIRTKY